MGSIFAPLVVSLRHGLRPDTVEHEGNRVKVRKLKNITLLYTCYGHDILHPLTLFQSPICSF